MKETSELHPTGSRESAFENEPGFWQCLNGHITDRRPKNGRCSERIVVREEGYRNVSFCTKCGHTDVVTINQTGDKIHFRCGGIVDFNFIFEEMIEEKCQKKMFFYPRDP